MQVASLVELSREGVPYTYVVSRLHVRSLTCSWPISYVVSREGVPFTYVVSRDGARPTRARPWTFELEDSFHLRLLACAGTFWSNRKTRGFNIKKFGSVIAFLAIFFGALTLSGYSNIALVIFAENDEGNIVRYLQLSDLFADMNLVGQGLGAVVPGNVRDVDRPYGFELSYINLIHKLGVISLLLFFGYLLSLKRIIAYGKSAPANLRYAAAALGCFCFVFVGIGNPIISSPQMVLLHCIGLFLIRGGRKRS